jgi:hypothetical protein
VAGCRSRAQQHADILNTTKYVVDHDLGDVISQSFGEAEACMDPALLAQQHQVFADATSKGITLFASSGGGSDGPPAKSGPAAHVNRRIAPLGHAPTASRRCWSLRWPWLAARLGRPLLPDRSPRG